MAPVFKPVEYFTSKFYERGKESKSFMDLTEDDIKELAKKVEDKRRIMADNTSYRATHMPKFDIYQSTLEYLTNPTIHLKFKTFDEKVAFLILMVDPNLVSYKEYLKLDVMSKEEIDNIKDSKVKEALKQKRRQAILEFQSSVREKLGFYDPKLIKYEELFFKRYLADKELITDVRVNNQEDIIFRAGALRDFNRVSDERFEQLKEIAQGCLAIAPYDTKNATYSVINQKKLLGISGIPEQLALFILLVDSELDMLRIYEEESLMSEVERRITEQFGYFNPELLKLEKKYHKRFCPDKELGFWTNK